MAAVAAKPAADGAAAHKLPLPNRHVRTLKGHEGPVYKVRFNSDCQYCMTAGHDRTVKLWNPNRESDVETTGGFGLLIKSYGGVHSHPVHDVAIAKDNNKFASCGGDKSGYLWDVATGKMIRKYFGHEGRVNAVAFNLDSTVLLTGSYDQTVRAWDCRSFSRTPIQTLKQFKDSVSTVMCTRDEIIAGCIDGAVRTYDLRAGKLRVDEIHDSIISVSLSHDGNCLLAGCLAGKASARLVLLEKATGELLNEYRGHDNESYAVDSTFANTDAYLASGSESGTVHFWDLVEGGSPVHALRGHTRAVCSVAFHSEDPLLLTASHDGTVRVWDRAA